SRSGTRAKRSPASPSIGCRFSARRPPRSQLVGRLVPGRLVLGGPPGASPSPLAGPAACRRLSSGPDRGRIGLRLATEPRSATEAGPPLAHQRLVRSAPTARAVPCVDRSPTSSARSELGRGQLAAAGVVRGVKVKHRHYWRFGRELDLARRRRAA